jgi:hypothetical protein
LVVWAESCATPKRHNPATVNRQFRISDTALVLDASTRAGVACRLACLECPKRRVLYYTD